jgi:plasmid stabilization system protein ParE
MRLRWTLPAVADLEQIESYLSVHYPHVAHRTVNQIYDSVRSLKRFPNRGRIGLRRGTRTRFASTPLYRRL